MISMTLSCLAKEDLLIVGSTMRYQGVDHFKQCISRKEEDSRIAIEESVAAILNCLKRSCRIDLRTDLHWLAEERWTNSESMTDLKKAIRRHQITWTYLLPECKAILDLQKRLAQESILHRRIFEILCSKDCKLTKKPRQAPSLQGGEG